jgi:hypothetical protein
LKRPVVAGQRRRDKLCIRHGIDPYAQPVLSIASSASRTLDDAPANFIPNLLRHTDEGYITG